MPIWVGSLAAFAAYFTKGIAGFANTLVFSSLLSFFTANRNITPVDLILGLPSNAIIAWKARKRIRRKVALPLIGMLLAGMVPGAFVLQRGDERAIKIFLGACIIALAAEMTLREMRPGQGKGHPAALLAVGLVSGFLCGLFGIGAFLVAYLARTTRDNTELRGTLCLVFLADNFFRILLYIPLGLLTWQAAGTALLLAPAMAAGLALGILLEKRLPPKTVRSVVLVLLYLMGISILAQNLFSF